MPKTNHTPKVSIVMPAYNAGGFIAEVIATITNQSFKDFELIIIDDGSTDNTAAIVKHLAKLDDRIKYFYQKNNGSARLGETLNTGIAKAKADLIARADSDDPWFLDKLHLQVEFMDANPDYIIVGGGTEIINEAGRYQNFLPGPLDDEDHRRSMTLYTTIAHGSVMFRKKQFETVGGYRNVHTAEDLDLWQRMSDHGKIFNITTPLFQYRRNSSGISMGNWWIQSQEVERLGYEYFHSHTPSVLSINKLKERLQFIDRSVKESGLPKRTKKEMRQKFIDDNYRIAKRFSAAGKRKGALIQIINLSLSSLDGLKYVIRKAVVVPYYRIKGVVKV